MKRVLAVTALLLAIAMPADASTAPPDYKLRCKNGKYAKVWITHAEDDRWNQTLRAVNNCGKHSKQWLMINTSNEDGSSGSVISIQPGASCTDSSKGWEEMQIEGDLSVRLGRGMFCDKDHAPDDDEDGYVRAIVIYRDGSTWRADCPE